MSVHGEYSRVLEAMLDRLRSLDHAESADWRQRLEDARISQQPDLSSAARVCLDVLAAIGRDPVALRTEGLFDPWDRLEDHCRVILGAPSAADQASSTRSTR